MQLRYLHQDSNPILPAIGDVRFLATLEYSKDKVDEKPKSPRCEISVAKCVEIAEHHVIYEILGKNLKKAVPYEIVDSFGYLSIDDCIRHTLNSFIEDIVRRHSKDSVSMFSNNSDISEYYVDLKDLLLLSRQVLKEADKAKNLYVKEIEK